MLVMSRLLDPTQKASDEITAKKCDKNNLPIGTVLHLNGYNDDDYCIIEKKPDTGYGTSYQCINIRTKAYWHTEAFSMLHISQKKDNRIQVYATDQIYMPIQIAVLKSEAKKAEIAAVEAKEKEKIEPDAKTEQYKKDFPFLTLGAGAAKNIKIELTRKFKDVKFSVRTSTTDSVYISWIDGPTEKQVKEISGKYSAGDFNGMEDIYEYSSSEWHIFGSARYIFTERSFSETQINTLLPAINTAAALARADFATGNKSNLTSIYGTEYLIQFNGYRFPLWNHTYISECYDEKSIAERILEIELKY